MVRIWDGAITPHAANLELELAAPYSKGVGKNHTLDFNRENFHFNIFWPKIEDNCKLYFNDHYNKFERSEAPPILIFKQRKVGFCKCLSKWSYHAGGKLFKFLRVTVEDFIRVWTIGLSDVWIFSEKQKKFCWLSVR